MIIFQKFRVTPPHRTNQGWLPAWQEYEKRFSAKTIVFVFNKLEILEDDLERCETRVILIIISIPHEKNNGFLISYVDWRSNLELFTCTGDPLVLANIC